MPGDAGNVADNIGQLDIHLAQGFLHAIDGFGLIGGLYWRVDVPASALSRFHVREKSAAQQAMRHELPNPLAIENVGFTARGLACARELTR